MKGTWAQYNFTLENLHTETFKIFRTDDQSNGGSIKPHDDYELHGVECNSSPFQVRIITVVCGVGNLGATVAFVPF